jgi:hypothetical protein
MRHMYILSIQYSSGQKFLNNHSIWHNFFVSASIAKKNLLLEKFAKLSIASKNQYFNFKLFDGLRFDFDFIFAPSNFFAIADIDFCLENIHFCLEKN